MTNQCTARHGVKLAQMQDTAWMVLWHKRPSICPIENKKLVSNKEQPIRNNSAINSSKVGGAGCLMLHTTCQAGSKVPPSNSTVGRCTLRFSYANFVSAKTN